MSALPMVASMAVSPSLSTARHSACASSVVRLLVRSTCSNDSGAGAGLLPTAAAAVVAVVAWMARGTRRERRCADGRESGGGVGGAGRHLRSAPVPVSVHRGASARAADTGGCAIVCVCGRRGFDVWPVWVIK